MRSKIDFLAKKLIFGVHFGVHILIPFSLYNKYPHVKTWGISYAGEALCYQPPSTRVLRSAICILLLERAIRIIYPQLFPKFIFLQLILYILFYLLSIFSYCIDIVSFAPKFSIPIFEFEIPPLLIYH